MHRVQRVPQTESGGRVHTSTATVAVMPEVDDVAVHIDPADVEVWPILFFSFSFSFLYFLLSSLCS